jgi:hypothetical protein
MLRLLCYKAFLRVSIFQHTLSLPAINLTTSRATAVYPKSHTRAQCSKPQKTNDFATKEAQANILLGGLGWLRELKAYSRAARCRGKQMQWRSRVSVELSAVARSFTPTERANVMAAGAGLATLVRGRRLRRPQGEETSVPWRKRGLASWLGLNRTLQCYGSLSAHL